MGFIPGFDKAFFETLAPQNGPWNFVKAAVREVMETAAQKVFGRQAADGVGIGDHIGQAGNFAFAVTNDHCWQTVSQDFIELLNVTQNDAVGPQGFELWPGFFKAARLPVKGPWPVVTGIIGNAPQQITSRSAG